MAQIISRKIENRRLVDISSNLTLMNRFTVCFKVWILPSIEDNWWVSMAAIPHLIFSDDHLFSQNYSLRETIVVYVYFIELTYTCVLCYIREQQHFDIRHKGTAYYSIIKSWQNKSCGLQIVFQGLCSHVIALFIWLYLYSKHSPTKPLILQTLFGLSIRSLTLLQTNIKFLLFLIKWLYAFS